MKQLLVILITAFTLSIAGALYATYDETNTKEPVVTEYVHLGQLDQPTPGFAQW